MVESNCFGNWEGKIFLFIVFTLFFPALFMGDVNAIGMSPARTNLDFEPGNHCSSFSIFNVDKINQKVTLVRGGDLATYSTSDKNEITFSAQDTRENIEVCLALPNTLEEGYHAVTIMAVSDPETSMGVTSLSARTAVAGEIRVFVPYERKFVETVIATSEDGSGIVYFHVLMKNLGEELVDRAVVSLDIFDNGKKKLDSLKTESFVLPTGSSQSTSISLSGLNVGNYVVVVTTTYDGGKNVHEQDFTVFQEQLYVDILDVKVDEFSLGDIGEFEVTLSNEDIEDVVDAHVEIKLYDDKKEIVQSGLSSVFTLSGNDDLDVLVYLDTATLERGEYTAGVSLFGNGIHYLTREFSTLLKEDGAVVSPLTGRVTSGVSFSFGTTTFLVVGILVLLILNVLWIKRWRKRRIPPDYRGIP